LKAATFLVYFPAETRYAEYTEIGYPIKGSIFLVLLKILGEAVTRLFVNPLVSSVAQNPFFGTNLKVVNEQRFALSSRHKGVTKAGRKGRTPLRTRALPSTILLAAADRGALAP
jgi:hypothetical protein